MITTRRLRFAVALASLPFAALASCGDDDRPSGLDGGRVDAGPGTDGGEVDATVPTDGETPPPPDAGEDVDAGDEVDAGSDGGAEVDAGTNCGDGVIDLGEMCDPGVDLCCNETCDGPGVAGLVCRVSAGVCDLDELCDGVAT